MNRLLFCLIVVLLLFVGAAQAADEQALDFSAWLNQFRSQARAEGISAAVLDQSLRGLDQPLPRVIELDRRQPELTQTLTEYLSRRVTPALIAEGRTQLQRYPTWLGRVEQHYQVDRAVIVALWGIETRYGTYTGGFPVIHALATLAHDGRRGAYFQKELINALRIVEQGHMSANEMTGSWAGAMGQCQFMPSSFLRYAVDADGGGRIDIWGTHPDIFASIANYLHQSGWQTGQSWGQPVRLPAGFDPELAGSEQTRQRWHTLGVRGIPEQPLPVDDQPASLLLPEGPDGPAYLVYANFQVLLRWNRANLFAIAVGTLTDQLRSD